MIISKQIAICRSNLISYGLILITITIVSHSLIQQQQGAFAKNQVATTTTANVSQVASTATKTSAICNNISGCVNDMGLSGTVYDPRTGTTMPIAGIITTGGGANGSTSLAGTNK
ncbi:MAG: hypothetical protein JO297_08315 [Nitrososphaeraceae archaeon]|nr:hypothetical protein [Nitrososphaeraceae archaeon]